MVNMSEKKDVRDEVTRQEQRRKEDMEIIGMKAEEAGLDEDRWYVVGTPEGNKKVGYLPLSYW